MIWDDNRWVNWIRSQSPRELELRARLAGWKPEDEKSRHRECPNCDGFGWLFGDPCSYCRFH